jgi:hypothetical protein
MVLVALLSAAALLAPAPAVRAGWALPEGMGLAARYPGDNGIGRDQAVIFADGMESGKPVWDNREGKGPRATHDHRRVHSGRFAAELTCPPGKGAGAPGLVKWFDPGYEQVYARWYVMFAEDYDQGDLHHAAGNLVGMNDHWLLGVSGRKPDGTDLFSTGLETWRDWKRNPAPGEVFMYTYYPDMKRDPDGNYWGNTFRPERRTLLDRGRWYCLEMMVKLNHPDRADGEQACWVDGKLIGHFTGIRWRTVDTLKVNGFWLELYIHDNPKANTLWYDDAVVSRSYIGPMKPRRIDTRSQARGMASRRRRSPMVAER